MTDNSEHYKEHLLQQNLELEFRLRWARCTLEMLRGVICNLPDAFGPGRRERIVSIIDSELERPGDIVMHPSNAYIMDVQPGDFKTLFEKYEICNDNQAE